MTSHRRGSSTEIVSWKTAVFLIIAVIVAYIITSDDDDGTGATSGTSGALPTASAPAPVVAPSLITKRTLPGNVEMTLVDLKPNEWSEWVTTPMGGEYRIDWNTVTMELEIWFQDGTVVKKKLGDHLDVGLKRGVFKFRSLRGGKVTVAAKGGWKDFLEWK